MFPNFLIICYCLLPHKEKPVPSAHLWSCHTCHHGGWPEGQAHSFRSPTPRNSFVCWDSASFQTKKPQATNNKMQQRAGPGKSLRGLKRVEQVPQRAQCWRHRSSDQPEVQDLVEYPRNWTKTHKTTTSKHLP